jgi:ribosomal protein S18 acetylase RimI-like enzyme
MHFDREGLIVATKDGLPVGFVHAGFGPDETGNAIDTTLGTTHMLMLRAGHEDVSLAEDLLAASEEYLRGRGAKVLYAGGIKPLNSFYLGLYGGSEIPGVLQTNHLLCEACRRRGYRESGQVTILQCDLVRFRPPISRKVRLLRRPTTIVESLDPIAKCWWEACVWGSQERDRFQLVTKAEGQTIAYASFWDVQPLSTCWGICTAGLFDLFVEPEWRRQGCGSYLLSEAFRLLRRRGVATIEAQTMSTNEAALAFYRSLSFETVDHGFIFRKDANTQMNGVARAELTATATEG